MRLVASFPLVPFLSAFLAIREVALPLVSRLCLLMGVGIGLASCSLFLALETRLAPLLLDLAELALVLAIMRWRSPRRRRDGAVPQPRERWTALQFALLAVFLLLSALAAYYFVRVTLQDPHGKWDAWMIWNLKARYLVTDQWRAGFSAINLWSHPDYPLLIPGIVARIWKAFDTLAPLAPQIVSGVFTLGVVALLVSSVTHYRGRTSGILAGMALLGTADFVGYGAWQCADVPVSFFILASLILLTEAEVADSAALRLTCLGGLMAGMGAWTKNEGLLWIVAILIAVLGRAVFRGNTRRRLASGLAVLMGALPILVIALIQKYDFHAPNPFLGHQSPGSMLVHLADAHRWKVLAIALGQELSGFGGIAMGAFCFVVMAVGCMGIELDVHRRAIATAGGALLVFLAGCCLVMVISPFQIEWQVRTAMTRVIIQIWPGILFLAFLALRNSRRDEPESAVVQSEGKAHQTSSALPA